MYEQTVAVCGNPYKPITVGQHVDAGLAVQSPQSLAVDVADMGKPFCVGINMPQFSLLCGDNRVASVVAFHRTTARQSVRYRQGFGLLPEYFFIIALVVDEIVCLCVVATILVAAQTQQQVAVVLQAHVLDAAVKHQLPSGVVIGCKQHRPIAIISDETISGAQPQIALRILHDGAHIVCSQSVFGREKSCCQGSLGHTI